jgi:hypothetical protein
VVTVSGGFLAIMSSVVTAVTVHFGGFSWKVGALWALSLGLLATGAKALRAEGKAVDPDLALTPMEQVVVRGYLVAPPNLLQPTDPGIETRLAALAALASCEIRQSPVWGDDRFIVDAAGLELDRTVTSIYELAHHINEARVRLSSTEAPSHEACSASAELAGALDSAQTNLEMLVTGLCSYADSFLRVERLFLDEERLMTVMDLSVDAEVCDLVTSSIKAECATSGLNERSHELEELKGVLDARRPMLTGSWPDHPFGE